MTKNYLIPLIGTAVIAAITLWLKDFNKGEVRVATATTLNLQNESQAYRDVFSILNKKCVHCHASYSGYSEVSWVLTGQVQPGSPEKSYLYQHLRGVGGEGPQNMPPKKSLSKSDRQLIAKWIENLDPSLGKTPLSFSLPTALAKKINKELTLSEEELYYRCHSHFVREAPTPSDSILKLIKAGHLSAVDGCLQLIQAAQFSDGPISKTSYKIRQTFHSLHNSWFENFVLFNLQASFPTYDVVDIGGPALYFTRSLFSQQFPFPYIFNSDQTLEAVREASQQHDAYIYQNYKESKKLSEHGFFVGKEEGLKKAWTPQFVSHGLLKNIRPTKKNKKDILPLYMDQTDSYLAKVFQGPLNIRAHLGGGVMGSPSFLLFNHGRESGETMDGGLLLPRRWSKMVFKNLMCRDLPLLRKADVIQQVQKKSQVSFRKQTSCMQCHVSMDQMAGAARQITPVVSSDHPDGHTQHIKIHQADPTLADGPLVTDQDHSYHLRAPKGRLVYRNLYGDLVNRPFQNMQDLGQQLLKEDDVYICTAKKYLYFLTGIDVTIEDYSQKLTRYDPISLEYIRFLIFLGKRLKEHGRLAFLLKDIVASDIYRQKDFQIYGQMGASKLP